MNGQKLAWSIADYLAELEKDLAGLDEETRKIIEHGRRIRVCLKQPEFAPVSVPDQVAILLALTGRPFDPVLIERMTEAQQAVREAAPAIPPEVMPV